MSEYDGNDEPRMLAALKDASKSLGNSLAAQNITFPSDS